MRVDTTMVKTKIHFPTDSTLLGDGACVLTRLVKRIGAAAGGLKTKLRNRMRTVRRKVVAIAIASRQKGAAGEEKRKKKVRNQAQGGTDGSGRDVAAQAASSEAADAAVGHNDRAGHAGGEADPGAHL